MQLIIATMPEPEILPACKRAGRITGTFLTADKSEDGFQTLAAASLILEFEGIAGSRHRGWTRAADVRAPHAPRRAPIRNTRALTIVSMEDLAEAARRMDIADIDPRWIGANLLVEGFERFSFLPRGTHLICDGGAILIVEDQNAPCRFSGAAIANHTPGRPELEFDFPRQAARLRGVVASVEHPGTIAPGCAVTARIPEQWLYRSDP